MTKLNKTAATAVISGRIPSAVVGVNRRLERNRDGLAGKLHGHAVVVRAPDRVIIRHYGFKTRTTQIAIQDFLDLLGVDGRVSFAGSKFRVVINGTEYVADDGIEVVIPAKCGVKK